MAWQHTPMGHSLVKETIIIFCTSIVHLGAGELSPKVLQNFKLFLPVLKYILMSSRNINIYFFQKKDFK